MKNLLIVKERKLILDQRGWQQLVTVILVVSEAQVEPYLVLRYQGKGHQSPHGIPDFAEVYSFIGGVFDPDSQGHFQKLKEMDPINFETVLLLMRNLSFNLSSPDFEPIDSTYKYFEVILVDVAHTVIKKG